MKIAAIVQARIGSTRLPGKVMKKINDQTIIELLLSRLLKSSEINQIIVATSDDQNNLPLIEHIQSLNYSCEIGSEDDVLSRYFHAAAKHQVDIIVRITGDCPCVDPEIIDKAVLFYKAQNVDYISNTNPPSYPDGLDVEVFSFSALSAAYKKATSSFDREHVTPFIRNNKDFQQSTFHNDEDFSNMRWTLDEIEDFEVVQNIFQYFQPDIFFHWSKIIKLQQTHPMLFSANKKYSRGMI